MLKENGTWNELCKLHIMHVVSWKMKCIDVPASAPGSKGSSREFSQGPEASNACNCCLQFALPYIVTNYERRL